MVFHFSEVNHGETFELKKFGIAVPCHHEAVWLHAFINEILIFPKIGSSAAVVKLFASPDTAAVPIEPSCSSLRVLEIVLNASVANVLIVSIPSLPLNGLSNPSSIPCPISFHLDSENIS